MIGGVWRAHAGRASIAPARENRYIRMWKRIVLPLFHGEHGAWRCRLSIASLAVGNAEQAVCSNMPRISYINLNGGLTRRFPY